jgi:hypothetical protein
MVPSATRSDPPSLSEAFRRLTDGIQRLIRDHLALVRTELRQDLKAAGRDIAFALLGVPSLLLGYALLMVALSLALAPSLGAAVAFAIVGAVNLLAGGALAFFFGRRLATRDRPDLDRVTTQLKEDGRWLRDLRRN